MLVQLFFVIYIFFSCFVEGDDGKNLTKKVQQTKQQPCAFITLESSTSPSLPATQQCTTAEAMACNRHASMRVLYEVNEHQRKRRQKHRKLTLLPS